VDKRGETVKTAVKPGTRVRVYYTNVGHQRVIDHVVVLDWPQRRLENRPKAARIPQSCGVAGI